MRITDFRFGELPVNKRFIFIIPILYYIAVDIASTMSRDDGNSRIVYTIIMDSRDELRLDPRFYLRKCQNVYNNIFTSIDISLRLPTATAYIDTRRWQLLL